MGIQSQGSAVGGIKYYHYRRTPRASAGILQLILDYDDVVGCPMEFTAYRNPHLIKSGHVFLIFYFSSPPPLPMSHTGTDRRTTGIAHAVLNAAPGTNRSAAQLPAPRRCGNGLILQHTVDSRPNGHGIPATVAALKVSTIASRS